jgi:hypothetical protein
LQILLKEPIEEFQSLSTNHQYPVFSWPCPFWFNEEDTVFGTALLTTAILGLSLASVNSITSVFASVDQLALQSVDLHLEECIKALQVGDTEGALTHCELSDQELDPLLQNTTG